MVDAYPAPPGHDGMGVVAVDGDDIILVRNHELSRGGLIVADACYESGEREDGTQASGGNTNLYFPAVRSVCAKHVRACQAPW